MEQFFVKKPWGAFRQFTHNEKTTVKLLFVNSEQELSLQTHKKRSEFWYIINGNPEIIIGSNVINAKTGDMFTIPVGEKHRIRTTQTKEDATLLEIAYGDFDEEDIVRYDDKYGRA